MDVLHAFWDDSENGGILHIWGESTDRFREKKGSKAEAKNSQSLSQARIRSHPFALPQSAIKEIGKVGLGLTSVPRNYFNKHVVRLPSMRGIPCPSPELSREKSESDFPATRWVSWEVQALCVPGNLTYIVLRNLMQNCNTPGCSFCFGKSLWYWLRVMQHAELLVARQEFLPTLKEIHRQDQIILEARWVPQLSAGRILDPGDEEGVRLAHDLTRSMPPMCYADFHDEEVLLQPAKRGALMHALFTSFLGAAINSFVREVLAQHSKFHKTNRKDLARQGHSAVLHVRKKTPPTVMAYFWLNDLLSKENTLSGIYISKYTPSTFPTTATYSESQLAWAFAREIETKTGLALHKDWGSPFEICFQLVEPQFPENDNQRVDAGVIAEEDSWELRFGVRLRDQPTNLTSATHVWGTASKKLVLGHQVLSNPQQFLVEGLVKASRIYTPLQPCLQMPFPCNMFLTTEQAYDFLISQGEHLAREGFGVVFPQWWASRGSEISAILHLNSKQALKAGSIPSASSKMFTTSTLMDYNWKIAIGDEELSAAEFNQLVQQNAPLICFRGNWVEMTQARRQQLLKLSKKPKKVPWEMSFGKALRLALGQEVLPEGIRVKKLEGDAEIQGMIDKLAENTSFMQVPPPLSFCGELRPYQVNGLSWLAFLSQFQLGACLADDMGLGKTIQVIALLLHEKEKHQQVEGNGPTSHQPSLLICPTSIVGNWARELKRFGPSLSFFIHHGANRIKCAEFQEHIPSYDLIITTYALVFRDAAHLLPVSWDYIIVDEAQNIKNHLTKQAQAIKELVGTHRIALTGTPVENRLAELWSIMEFLNPGYLGSLKEFHTTFERPIVKNHDPDQTEVLKRVIQPFVLRRLKTDKKIIQDLPEKMEIKEYCNITTEQAALYQGLVDIMLGKIERAEGIERKGLILATLLKLKQVCDHPALIQKDQQRKAGHRSGKLTRLEEMLDEVRASGEKALIFTQFVKMGSLLQDHLAEHLGCEVLFLHGSTTLPHREEMIRRFQEEPEGPPIFILSLKAGGVGLNLTAANHVFHFDRWWNPAVENQATDRTFRIGQLKNVEVYKFICTGTLEEHIDEMIEEKVNLAENVIGGGETWLTEMSTDQLKTIFTLRRDVINDSCEN